MRYLYYDEVAKKVHIRPEESTDHGRLLGSVTEDDFDNIRTNFLVQALFHRARIDQTGLTIETMIGPANYP
jgi:hypothetical protein